MSFARCRARVVGYARPTRLRYNAASAEHTDLVPFGIELLCA
ncbi:MAG: hypothetical protein ACKVWV_09885 [Planctomycetota bacterium]